MLKWAEVNNIPDWSGLSHISYHEFIETRRKNRYLEVSIGKELKNVTATNEQLVERGIRASSDSLDKGIDRIIISLDEGFDRMSYGMDDIREEIIDLRYEISRAAESITSALYWGFSQIDESLKLLRSDIKELITIQRNPSEVWAYEQFAKACEFKRRGLYKDALDFVTRAIRGSGESHPGYPADFHFYALLGSLRLGNYHNTSRDVVDPKAAEIAFAKGAEYATAYGNKVESGTLLIGAGRASFLLGAHDHALQHLEKGLMLNKRHAAGHYLAARIYALKLRKNDAINSLTSAFFIDPTLALTASAEMEFQNLEKWIKEAISLAQKLLDSEYQKTDRDFIKSLNDLRSFAPSYKGVDNIIMPIIVNILEVKNNAEKSFKASNLIGAFNAIQILESRKSLFYKDKREFSEKFYNWASAEINRETGKLNSLRKSLEEEGRLFGEAYKKTDFFFEEKFTSRAFLFGMIGIPTLTLVGCSAGAFSSFQEWVLTVIVTCVLATILSAWRQSVIVAEYTAEASRYRSKMKKLEAEIQDRERRVTKIEGWVARIEPFRRLTPEEKL